MIILRLFLVLATLALVLSGGMYLFTRDRRYLRLAQQVAYFTVLFLSIFALLYLLERFVLTGWRILL